LEAENKTILEINRLSDLEKFDWQTNSECLIKNKDLIQS